MKTDIALNLVFLLNCLNCRTRWSLTVRSGDPNLKSFQQFLNVPCLHCGTDCGSIALMGIEQRTL